MGLITVLARGGGWWPVVLLKETRFDFDLGWPYRQFQHNLPVDWYRDTHKLVLPYRRSSTYRLLQWGRCVEPMIWQSSFSIFTEEYDLKIVLYGTQSSMSLNQRTNGQRKQMNKRTSQEETECILSSKNNQSKASSRRGWRRRSSLSESLPETPQGWAVFVSTVSSIILGYEINLQRKLRSEERRVGKEC